MNFKLFAILIAMFIALVAFGNAAAIDESGKLNINIFFFFKSKLFDIHLFILLVAAAVPGEEAIIQPRACTDASCKKWCDQLGFNKYTCKNGVCKCN